MAPPGKSKIAVVEAYSGKIVDMKIVEGDLEEVVKETATRLLAEKWLPTLSDFVILRDTLDVELKLPLSNEEFSFYKRFNLKKIDANTASASLPLYLIVYESLKISEDEYHDRGIAAISVIYREGDIEELMRLLEESTRAPSLGEEEVGALEELDSEVVEEEKAKGKGGRKK